ncbi:MAG: HD domain-containing protein [Sedimentisphaerales bacterium]|nr:HD domain-containing protein [Sedimentisphaerales bacterium]
MPILLSAQELEPGMVVAVNVVNQYNVLLPHGKRITEQDIASLVKRFPDKMVHIVDPLLDDFVQFDDDSHDQEVSMEVRRNIATATHKVSALVRAGVALDADHLRGIEDVVNNMMKHLSQNPVTMAIIEQSAGWDDYLQEHSANVFYLSMLIGNTIKNYIRRERERLSAAKNVPHGMNITPLATAAMFHDIGMSPIEQLYRKSEPLTAEEMDAIRAHPNSGADMLPEEIDPMVKLIIRNHHENFDGTGYPRALPGSETNIFARILRVVDAYSAAISHQVYRKAKSPVKVLYEMLYGDYKRYYDPVVLKVFSGLMQPFPIGAKISLQDGRWAVVVKHNQQHCFKPNVIIAYDEFGDPIERENLQQPFSLQSRPDIKVKSFGEDDISFVNDLPETLNLGNQTDQGESSDDDPVQKIIEQDEADILSFLYP